MIRLAPWQLAHGEWVIGLKGISGGYKLSRVVAKLNEEKPLMNASVKVMRSYDYCHFEVALSIDDAASDTDVDQLRKRAQRLADKAVEQYKVAKRMYDSLAVRKAEKNQLEREVARIEEIEPGDRTPHQQAKVKLLKDRNWQEYIDQRYDYQDDWQEWEDVED